MEERLQKYMASCGVASRRKCEELILKGLVKVNNNIVTELGFKVNPTKDTVLYNNNEIKKEENKRYILLNKPEGYITSVKDEKGRETVLDIVKVEERIYPIGRLDFDTSGLLLLTNDGDIYNKIIHPRVQINKTYIALCKGEFSEEDIEKFETGIDIDGYVTSGATLKVLDVKINRNSWLRSSLVEINIHEGKNRQVRKMCDALGHTVLNLNRVQVGEIILGSLPKGEYRNLTNKELDYLNSL